MSELFQIIFEDAELLVINKPAGLVCHPTKRGEMSSLIGRARLYLGKGMQPRLVNRLDRETSGIVVVAKSAEVAGQLGKLWETRAVTKSYLAIVHGHVRDEHGLIDVPIGRDDRSPVAIKDCVRQDGAPAQTQFSVEQRFTRPEGQFSLLRLVPLTGRKHQIRIHLAHMGHPIVGDKLYGPDESCYLAFVKGQLTPHQQRQLLLPHQALHAEQVLFVWRGQTLALRAMPEPWFTAFIPTKNIRSDHPAT